MHYLIFIPGAKAANPAHLERVGLEDHAAGAEFHETTGPDNQRGVMCGWKIKGSPATAMAFRPEAQDWTPAARDGDLEYGRYSVGFWKDKPPQPKELQRDYPFRGTTLTLGDKQAWLMPKALELPTTMQLADDGSLKFIVQRRFHQFWLDSLHMAGRFEGVALREVWPFVARGLALNYRLTPEVVSRLGLITTENILSALLAIIGD